MEIYRLVKMTDQWYALKITSIELDADNIENFIMSGEVVVLGDDLEWIASELGITLDDIKEVE